MTDNEITREKTFSEELPYFKERMKEVFDYYDNPKGCAEMLYIDVLRDSNRLVRKAEEEITRQQTEIERLKGYNENLQAANTALSNEIIEIKAEAVKEFAERLKEKIDVVYSIKHLKDNIDNAVKEMVGE